MNLKAKFGPALSPLKKYFHLSGDGISSRDMGSLEQARLALRENLGAALRGSPPLSAGAAPWGCHNTWPPTGALKQQKFIVSQSGSCKSKVKASPGPSALWRLQGRVILPLPSPAARVSLACGRLPLTFVAISPRPPPVSVSLLPTSCKHCVLGFRPTRNPGSPPFQILNYISEDPFCRQGPSTGSGVRMWTYLWGTQINPLP